MEATYKLYGPEFAQQFDTIILLAVIGTLLNVFALGFVLYAMDGKLLSQKLDRGENCYKIFFFLSYYPLIITPWGALPYQGTCFSVLAYLTANANVPPQVKLVGRCCFL